MGVALGLWPSEGACYAVKRVKYSTELMHWYNVRKYPKEGYRKDERMERFIYEEKKLLFYMTYWVDITNCIAS